MTEQQKPISIWYFVGVLLTVYGVLIFGTGLYNLVSGARPDTVLSGLHVDLWWGALLLALGLVYVYVFSPRRRH